MIIFLYIDLFDYRENKYFIQKIGIEFFIFLGGGWNFLKLFDMRLIN